MNGLNLGTAMDLAKIDMQWQRVQSNFVFLSEKSLAVGRKKHFMYNDVELFTVSKALAGGFTGLGRGSTVNFSWRWSSPQLPRNLASFRTP